MKPSKICSRRVMKVCLINSHPGSRRFHASQRPAFRLFPDSPRSSVAGVQIVAERKKEKKGIRGEKTRAERGNKLGGSMVFFQVFPSRVYLEGRMR